MYINRNFLRAAGLGVGLSIVASSASAQAFDAVRLYGAARDMDGGTVGLAAIAARRYQGSDEHRYMVLPLLDYQWRSGWFAGTSNGIGFNFSGRPDISYGLRATADLGRKENRSAALAGLGNINPRPEFGGFFNYGIGRDIVLTSSLRYGAGDDRQGLLLDLGAVYSIRLAPQWRIGLGVAGTYANTEYTQTYFGIDSAQAGRSGYAPYSPGAGVRDVRANVALSYQLSPKMTLTGALSAVSLQGDAKRSPLVRDSRTVNAIVGVGYAF
ncbi:MAG: MipA/OmpV family protein [Burkholderiales bacterium]